MKKFLLFLTVLITAVYASAYDTAVGDKYELVTSTSNITVGDEYILCSGTNAMGAISGKYMSRVGGGVTISGNTVTINNTDVKSFKIVNGYTTGKFALELDAAAYLQCTSTSNNNLASGILNANANVEFVIKSGNTIEIKFSQQAKYLQFNTDRVSNYGDTMTNGQLYKKVSTEEGGEGSKVVTDVIDNAFTGVGTATSYSKWENKKGNSGAVYSGESAGGKGTVQLRATKPSGIVTTQSGGFVRKVVVTWNSTETAAGRTIDIYGQNSAYSSSEDLYDNKTQGTKLGSIVCGNSTECTITGDYEYIGLRSNSGALYADKIEITWEKPSDKTPAGLEFEETAFNAKMGQTFTAPELTNANNLTVSYTSSNTDVAIVKSDDGEVTLVAPGKTTITATSKEDDTYEAGSASYTLTVGPNGEMTVAEALAAINNGYEDTAQVAGYIQKIDDITDSDFAEYGNLTYYLVDNNEDIENDGANSLQIFRGYWKNGVKFTSKDQIEVGGYVVVEGKLINYNGNTPEMNSGSKIIEYTAPKKEPKDYEALDKYEEEGITIELGEEKDLELGESHPDFTIEIDPEEGLTIKDGIISARATGKYTVMIEWEGDDNWNKGDVIFEVIVTEPELGEIEVTVSDGQTVENEGSITVVQGTTITFTAKNATLMELICGDADIDLKEEGNTLTWTVDDLLEEEDVVVSATQGEGEGAPTKYFEFKITVKEPAPCFTITFDDNDSDASTDVTSKTLLEYITAGSYFVLSADNISKVYKGVTGIKFGTGKVAGEITLNLSDRGIANVTKIVVNARAYSASSSAALELNGTSQSISGTELSDYEYELDGSELESITLKTTNASEYRMYVKGLTIYYEKYDATVSTGEFDFNFARSNGPTEIPVSFIVDNADLSSRIQKDEVTFEFRTVESDEDVPEAASTDDTYTSFIATDYEEGTLKVTFPCSGLYELWLTSTPYSRFLFDGEKSIRIGEANVYPSLDGLTLSYMSMGDNKDEKKSFTVGADNQMNYIFQIVEGTTDWYHEKSKNPIVEGLEDGVQIWYKLHGLEDVVEPTPNTKAVAAESTNDYRSAGNDNSINIGKLAFADVNRTADLSFILAKNGASTPLTASSINGDDPKTEQYITLVKGKNDPTHVEDIAAEGEGEAEYYTLQGVRVQNPDKGIYIVKKGGKTAKVIL